MILNAFGKACPMPLVMAKKELDAGCTDLGVQVDNETAVKNLLRLGDKSGLAVGVDEIEGGWLVSFSGAPDGNAAASAVTETPVAPVCGPSGCGYAVFVGKDHVGEGDPQLGYNLMKMALHPVRGRAGSRVGALYERRRQACGRGGDPCCRECPEAAGARQRGAGLRYLP